MTEESLLAVERRGQRVATSEPRKNDKLKCAYSGFHVDQTSICGKNNTFRADGLQ